MVQHPPCPAHVVSARRIEKAVSEEFGISLEDIYSHRRFRKLVVARQIIAYLLSKITNLSDYEVGIRVGGKDRCTILYSISMVESLYQTNYFYRERYNRIVRSLNRPQCDTDDVDALIRDYAVKYIANEENLINIVSHLKQFTLIMAEHIKNIS